MVGNDDVEITCVDCVCPALDEGADVRLVVGLVLRLFDHAHSDVGRPDNSSPMVRATRAYRSLTTHARPSIIVQRATGDAPAMPICAATSAAHGGVRARRSVRSLNGRG